MASGLQFVGEPSLVAVVAGVQAGTPAGNGAPLCRLERHNEEQDQD